MKSPTSPPVFGICCCSSDLCRTSTGAFPHELVSLKMIWNQHLCLNNTCTETGNNILELPGGLTIFFCNEHLNVPKNIIYQMREIENCLSDNNLPCVVNLWGAQNFEHLRNLKSSFYLLKYYLILVRNLVSHLNPAWKDWGLYVNILSVISSNIDIIKCYYNDKLPARKRPREF